MKNFLLIILLLFIINNSLAQAVNIHIKVSDGISVDTLYFGLDPTATNGIDISLGENELPPFPPSGVFEARFIGDGLDPPVLIGEGLKKDYRPGDGTTLDKRYHKIKYQLGSGTLFMLSWWDIPNQDTVRLQDDIIGTLIDTSFTGTGNYIVRLNLNLLKFTVSYHPHTTPVDLVSLSSQVFDNNVKLLWSTLHELNNSGFEVQRKKSNEVVWSDIEFIRGNLNSDQKINYEYTDNNLQTGKYNYRLKQIDVNGNFEYFNLEKSVEIGIPDKLFLSQNFPNPFNPNTLINYKLPADGNVKLSVYDVSGKLISTLVNEFRTAGFYEVVFHADNLPSGIYYYKLESVTGEISKSMIVLK